MWTSPALQRRRAAGVLAGVIVLVALMGAVGVYGGTLLVVSRDVPTPDALLELASHESERLPATAELARRHASAIVLLTEPIAPTEANCSRCSERVDWLASLGVARARVLVLPRRVKNTHDEALAALDHCRTHAVRELIVITSPYHTRRSAATFDAVFRGSGIAVGVHPALSESRELPGRWWLHSYDRRYVAYEWAALVWYAIRYNITPLVEVPQNSDATKIVTRAPQFLAQGRFV